MNNETWRLLFTLILVVSLTGGCVTTKPHVVSQSRAAHSSPLPAGTWKEHTVGDTATTAAGNRVTVHHVQPRVRGATVGSMPATGADVEVCVRSDATQPAVFDRDLFRAQVGRNTRMAIPTGRVLAPSFDGITQVEPGRCIRGWLVFLLERGERPDAVLLLASSPIRWKLERRIGPLGDAGERSQEPFSKR